MVSINAFFNSGIGDLNQEIKDDIEVGLTTEKRSQYYYREYGVGTFNQENKPNTMILQILMRYAIMTFMSYRNTQVTNGSFGNRDLRAATSQSIIEVEAEQDPQGGSSLLNVLVPYIPLHDLTSTDAVSTKIDF